MEYLIKTGSERVAQQCRENIYAVQTLKDFQYIDRDGKDQVNKHTPAHKAMWSVQYINDRGPLAWNASKLCERCCSLPIEGHFTMSFWPFVQIYKANLNGFHGLLITESVITEQAVRQTGGCLSVAVSFPE